MSNTLAIIQKVKDDLSKYDDAGLINEDDLYLDIVQSLKRFGNDVCVLHETVVEVIDGKATLPNYFRSLYLAALCEPLAYKKSNIEFHQLQSSYFYKERVERLYKWNECETCCEDVEEKVIRENIYFKDKHYQFVYRNPRLLKLGRTFKKNAVHDSCRNKIVRSSPYEITIDGYTIHTNFDSGFIYIQFYGLPTDTEGNIEIPDVKSGHLDTYIEYYLKRRLAEQIMGNNDDQNLARMYGIYATQESVALRNASNSIKLSKLGENFSSRMKRIQQIEASQYDINFAEWH